MQSSFWCWNNLCQWLKYVQKWPPETVLQIKKFKFWIKNGLNVKLKHRKAQKMILSGKFGDSYGKAGDRYHVRESWHTWDKSAEFVCGYWGFKG